LSTRSSCRRRRASRMTSDRVARGHPAARRMSANRSAMCPSTSWRLTVTTP
jgi:hypothetical protein